MVTAKGKAHLYSAAAAYAASAALSVTHRVVVQPRPQFKPALTDFGMQPNSCTLICRFNGLYACNYCSFADPRGTKG